MNPVFQYTGNEGWTKLEEGFDQPPVVGKWYFWNEVWADAYGPFDTEALAEAALNQYVADYL